MTPDLKEIYIGQLIKQRVSECDISVTKISKFLQCSEEEVENIYEKKTVEAYLLLKLSKLLEYDFFRIYSQHLILYSPQASMQYKCSKTQLPSFRKNIYTKEIVEFMLDLLETQQKSKTQIVQEYGIPKTTLYKWITKYQK